MSGEIYLDHAATTPVAPCVRDAMLPFLQTEYGNPSSAYTVGVRAKEAVETARGTVAAAIGAQPAQIYFTSGGTESDNWALKAGAEAGRKKGRHIITTQIEHHAILHTCAWLEKQGYDVTYLPVGEQGIVSAKQVEQAIRDDTVLISVMFANNEVGTLQPIREIGAAARRRGVLFHTDAVQAFCQVPIEVDALGIDLLSASGHKCYGPKGTGFLYMGERAHIGSFLHGGAQERHLRAGTENVAGIVGFGEAVRHCMETMESRHANEKRLRDDLVKQILSTVPYARINGSRTMRLPNNANFSFQFIEGENLLALLDIDGICASGGSACTTGDAGPSHVLSAIGLPESLARGSVRFTLGEATTKEEIDRTVKAVRQHVEALRQVSPAYRAYMQKE